MTIKQDFNFPLAKAYRDYTLYYISECEINNDAHPLRFDDFACMYYGIPKNVAQQYVAEQFDMPSYGGTD